ncbi:hypothetical protein GOODEAATRI_033185, partial [Goodea atripinnis]
FDPHAICEDCLGSQHAHLAHCLSLPVALAIGRESDDSTCEDDGSSSPATASQLGSLDAEERQLSRCLATSGLPISTTTPLPAVSALLLELPSIIQEAASVKGLSVPQPAPP